MKKLTMVLLCALCVGAAEASLQVSPVRTRLAVEPGGHATASVNLTNGTGSAVAAQVVVVDWTVRGGTVNDVLFHQPGSQPFSCADDLEVWPAELEVPPGETSSVLLAAQLPSDAKGSCFAAVLIQTSGGSREVAGGARASIGINIAHLVTVDAAGRTTFAGEITDLAVSRPDDTGSLDITAKVHNLGNSGIRPEGSFAVMDERGGLVAKIPLTATFAQPGGTINMSEQWDGRLEPGSYRLLGTLDLGGDQLLMPELDFVVEDRIEVASLHAVTAGGPARATVRLANAGNLTHMLSGELAVRNAEGHEVASLPVEPVLALPGQEAEVSVQLPDLARGPYQLALTLADERVTLNAEAAFQLP